MAVSQQTFSGIGAGVSDIFAGFGAGFARSGDEAEAAAYRDAQQLALQNEKFTKESTAIQEAQKQRETLLSMGRTTSEIAGAGFSLSGSGLDILRSSAAQGALAKAVIGQQGLITEAGYKEQAQSYALMASAADNAAKGESLAQIGDFVAAGLSFAGSFASLGG